MRYPINKKPLQSPYALQEDDVDADELGLAPDDDMSPEEQLTDPTELAKKALLQLRQKRLEDSKSYQDRNREINKKYFGV